ncbi:MAG: outer membrane protein assembly factor BamA [Acidobacteriota bacterium]
MKRQFSLFSLFSFLFFAISFLSAETLIEKIEIIGNKKVSRDTIMFYIKSKEKEVYDEELLREDFKSLWNTGFFSNIKMEEEDGSNGKIVKIYLEENPVIKSVEYKTGKNVKEQDIKDKLKEKNIYILPYSYYDPYKILKVKTVISDLLQSKGLQQGKVEVKTKRDKDEVSVTFEVNEGPKIKVGKIVFEGNKRVGDGTLRRAMKDTKIHSIISYVTSKDVFSQDKLEADLDKVKEKYQSKGYMEVKLGKPEIEYIDKRTIFLKKQKMAKIAIPVEEGPQYRLNEINIFGNKTLPADLIKSLIKMKKGDVYSLADRNKSVENLQKLYGERGYFYAQIAPVENLNPSKRTVDLELHIQENDLAYLGKLQFKGNNFTKDFVIRREWLLREGDIFNTRAFEESLKRVKQLGLVDFEKFPEVNPDQQNPSKINVTCEVKELQRNQIQFTGGYSGYEGAFMALSYSTVNFLGSGETMDVTLTTGQRIKDYRFGFTEPYLLDLPITIGFNLYDRGLKFPDLYTRYGKGGDFIFAARIYKFFRTNITYSYEVVDVKDVNENLFLYDPYSYFYYTEGKRIFSSIIPTFYYSTVDSPIDPREGVFYLGSLRYSSSFLGGDVLLIRPRFEWKLFKPIWKNHVLGFHFEAERVKPLKEQQLPFYERLYMGGELSLRGFEFYTIGPKNEAGVMIGGDKSLLFNFEYQIPVGGPLKAIIFYDVGNVWAIGEKIDLSNLYSSTGLEARIFVPMLRVPFRLIFAYNPRKIKKEDSHFAFRFAIGTTF